jgi:hypothetical protein
MRKELVVYVNTNEEGEEVKVQRVADNDEFILLTAGVNRLVLNVNELMEAVGAIGHYSVLFDQEKRIREARATAGKITVSENDFNKIEEVLSKPSTANEKLKKALKKNKEDEDEIVFDAPVRNGPTASELALEKEMRLMKGDTLEITEKVK